MPRWIRERREPLKSSPIEIPYFKPHSETLKAEIESRMDWKKAARLRILEKVLQPLPDTENERIRKSLVAWLGLELDFDFSVSVQANQPKNADQQRLIAKKFGAVLNHYCLGRDWQKKTPDKRAFFIGTEEPGRGSGNTHLHFMLSLPPSYWQKVLASPEWKQKSQHKHLSIILQDLMRRKKIIEKGSIRFRPIKSEIGQIRAARYTVKQYQKSSVLILSTEFDTLLSP